MKEVTVFEDDNREVEELTEAEKEKAKKLFPYKEVTEIRTAIFKALEGGQL